MAFLDGFVLVAISALILFHVIPHAMGAGGLWVPLVALAGFFVPQLLEHTLTRAAHRAHGAALALAIGGLIIHAGLDGIALATPGGTDGATELAIAVVLHRTPEAIMIWALLIPTWRPSRIAGVLAMVGAATCAGYFLGDSLIALTDARWLALVQALVAGSLLHVMVHRPAPLTSPTRGSKIGKIFGGAGAVLAVTSVAVLSHAHQPLYLEGAGQGFTETFVALALETAPALLLAFLLAGLIQVVLPKASFRFLSRGRPASQAARGMAFGLPLPICSCGVIPLYQTLVSHGVPATAAMAFLVATPELGIDAVLISLPLLGGELTAIRVVAAAVVAFAIGWGVGRLAPKPLVQPDLPVATDRPRLAARLRSGVRFGLVEIVDHTGPWLLLGVAIAALAEPLLRGEWLMMLPWGIDVILFTLLGMPTYVCASGATPLAAVLIHKGVSPGAAIAFLLAGPATNVTTFGVLASAHGRKIAVIFAAAMAILSVGIGMGINLVLPDASGIELDAITEEIPSALEIVSLAALVVIFALSLLRQGPRGFLGQVLSPYGDDDDDGHGHGHGHDDDGHGHGHGHGHDREGGSGCC
jgi:hypothetical protein